jgi:hypothetical protein
VIGTDSTRVQRPAWWRGILLVTAAAAAILAFWHFRVVPVNPPPLLTPQNYDDYVYYYPTFHYAFGQLSQGHLPFWNPYQHAGSPLFATGQHLLLYPLNGLFLLLPTGHAMAATTLLHLLLALAGTYWLARTINLSAAAAATAATAFGFSAAILVLIYLPHHLYGAVWIPLQLALVHRTIRGPRRGLAATGFGAASAAQYLGGYPMFSLFAVYCSGAYASWCLIGLRRDGAELGELGRAVGWLLVGGVLAAALSAPQLLPAAELAARSPRNFSALKIVDVDGLYRSTRLADILSSSVFPGFNAQIYRPLPYVGLAALPLVGLALLNRDRRRETVFFLLLAVLSGLIAVGRHTPVFALYFQLPTSNWFRLTDRFFVITVLGLAILAGIGADELLRRASPRLRLPLALLLPTAVYATLFVAFLNRVAIPDTNPELHTLAAPAVDFLRQHQGYDRLYVPPPGVAPGWRPPSKAGMLHQLYVVGDRENVYSERFASYIDRTVDPQAARWARVLRDRVVGPDAASIPQGEFNIHNTSPNWRLLDLLGTRWIIKGPVFERGASDRDFPVAWTDGRITILENPAALPRAFVVHAAEVLAPTQVLDRLVDPSFDPRANVILERNVSHQPLPPAADAAPSEATIADYASDRVEVVARSSAPGFLVLTDQNYPGWSAEVDGTPVPIETADYLFRAVPLPAGEHRVVFRFTPRSFQIGAVIAAVAIAIVVGSALWSWLSHSRAVSSSPL